MCHITSSLLQHVLKNVLLQRECKQQTLTPLANSGFNNLHFTRECSDTIKVRWPKLKSFASSFFLTLHAKNYENRP